jgi:hypothetical protein
MRGGRFRDSGGRKSNTLGPGEQPPQDRRRRLRPRRVSSFASNALSPCDDVGAPRRHQITELPSIEADITEYRCHQRRCPACGKMTLASLPEEAWGQFGAQPMALIAYLSVVCRLPRLVVQWLLEGALQIPISLGSTQKAWEEASAAAAAPYEELQAALPAQPVPCRRGRSPHELGETLAVDAGGAHVSCSTRSRPRAGRMSAAPTRRHIRRRPRQ